MPRLVPALAPRPGAGAGARARAKPASISLSMGLQRPASGLPSRGRDSTKGWRDSGADPVATPEG
jgi:hypothetical protein